MAVVYLIDFVVMLIGLGWSLTNQLAGFAGPLPTVGYVLFLAGQAGLIALALAFRAGVAGPQGAAVATSYQRAWHRLTLGLELPGAWRRLAG